MARQLAKHQVGWNWNEVSRRYVKTTPEYWVPSCLREAAPDVKQVSGYNIKRSSEFLEDWNDICIDAVALYQKMVSSGVCAEQARAVLPVSPYRMGMDRLAVFWHVFMDCEVHQIHKLRHESSLI